MPISTPTLADKRLTRSAIPNDLTIGNNDLVMRRNAQGEAVDELDHLWFAVTEREAGQVYSGYKVIKLLMLRYLPQEAKKDAGLVAKTKAALVGLYNTQARFDVVQVVAGMFEPPIGIVQCYGVAAFEPTLEAAQEQADLGLAALQGVLSNYIQSRFVALDGQKAAWLLRALAEMPHSLVAIGHPDARQNARGGGRDTAEEQLDLAGQGAYTLQQNEMFFRGMAQLEEEFVFLLIAHRVHMHDITQMLAGISGEASVWASRVTGSKGLSFGVSVPIMLSGGLARTAGTNYAENEGRSTGQSVGDSVTNTHTEGIANTVGHAETHTLSHEVGTSHTEGNTVSIAEGTNRGTAHTAGTSESWGTSQTHTHTESSGRSDSQTSGVNVTESSGWSQGNSASVNVNKGTSEQHGTGWNAGVQNNHADSQGQNNGWNRSEGGSLTDGTGLSVLGGSTNKSVTQQTGVSWGEQNSRGTSDGHGVSAGVSGNTTKGTNAGTGLSAGVQNGVSGGRSVASVNTHTTVVTSSASDAVSNGVSHERGVSASDTTSQGTSQAVTMAHSSADTRSESFGESWGETNSWSRTKSVSDAVADGQTRGITLGETFATGIGRSLNAARSIGLSGGVVPSLSASKSYNWVDAQAQQVAELIRVQEALLVQASTDGAFLTDVYMLTRSRKGRATAETLLRQAFHGSEKVVTGFRTRRLNDVEQEYIRRHALAFTPSTRVETIPGVLEAYRDTTFLPPEKLAALFAPGLFERGPAVTTEERIPPFTFIPDLVGDAQLGRLWDVETATLTKAILRLSEDKHMHTAFCGDTGYGKTVGAERLCVEVVNKWHHRAVVFDWGQGWRKLFTSPISRERVAIYQLHARAVNPLRWNPLQIGQRIDPDTQWRATVELVANAGGLGSKQASYLLGTLRRVYIAHGVFTSDPEVQSHDAWGLIRDGVEAAVTGAAIGAQLSSLDADQLQALAVQRSKDTDIADWVLAIDERLNGTIKHQADGSLERDEKGNLKRNTDGMGKNDPNRASLEAAVARMERLTQGVIGRRYAKGPGSIAIEDLGLYGPASDRWGVAVLEGGAELDTFSKSVLLGLIAWHLYNDSVIRRRESIGQKLPALNLFFEEANKIFSGEAPRGDGHQPPSIAEQFIPMFTDGRKYRVYCHPIVQTVSLLPAVILSSCVNLLAGQSKGVHDRDAILAHLAKSEKGFTDEEYKRFVSRMKVAMTICKLGYGHELWEIGPMLVEVDQIPAVEPTDDTLRQWYALAFLSTPVAARVGERMLVA